jgi:SAM-dependent methyltransferase
MTFTAHNIMLPDGPTMPSLGWFIADSPLTKSALAVMRIALGDLMGKSVADLGCLEGGYTAEFARHGMEALGIEVRESNLANCALVKEALGLDNLEFKQDDVWNLQNHGPFDAIFCSGLLYHLDNPAAFIRLMGERARRVCIIHTHFAREDDIEAFPSLSPLTTHEGFDGRWYHEHDAKTKEELESFKWTSWENKQSFWLTRAGIMQSLVDVGFAVAFEQFDWLHGWAGHDIYDSMTSGYYKTHARGMFVGIRLD